MWKYLKIAFKGFLSYFNLGVGILPGGKVPFGEGLVPTWVPCIVAKGKLVRIRKFLCYWNIFGAK